MKISIPGQARATYIDRNPAKVTQFTQANLAPHALTARNAYTVPAGRKFALDQWQHQAFRLTVAAPAGAVLIEAENAVSQQIINSQDVGPNTVGRLLADRGTGPLDLLAGEQLNQKSSDASTGGTIQYTISIFGIEYDA